MKNIYVFLFLLIIPFLVLGQITLTADDLPQAGDVFSSVNCEIPVGFSVGSPGANQTYDFSMLTPTDTFTNNFISPIGTAGFSEFPNATLAEEFEGNFVYYQQTSSELLLLGLYADTSANGMGQYMATQFNPSSKVFEIPSTYNTSYIDMSGWTNTSADDSGFADSIRTTISFVDTVLFDGYGTVIMPNGSFDGLRERRISTINSVFETYSMGVWTVFINNTETDTSYNWYGNNNVDLASVNIFDGEIMNISYSISGAQVLTPVASFDSNDLGGGTVKFNDNSTNLPTSWLWDFGDGNTSMAQNPEHTYTSAGTYNVCLTATNSAGSNMICLDVTVTFIPVSDFTFNVLSNGIVDFMDASTNSPSSWAWDFGDGNNSIEQNPQHTFSVANTYNVCLTATNSAGENTYCEMVDVMITATNELSNSVAVKVFPNPVNQVLNIHLENKNPEPLYFQLMNSLGQAVSELKVNAVGLYSIDVKNLNTGMYYYVLKDNNGQVRNRGSIGITGI